MNPRFINEYRMSNNEYRDVQQWIQDPTMNSLMDFQFFEIQFFEIQFFEIQFFETQFFKTQCLGRVGEEKINKKA